MAGDPTSQQAAHRFFIDRLKDDGTFTKQEVMDVTGWDKSSADTYWSKHFKGFLDQVPGATAYERTSGLTSAGENSRLWRHR